MATNSTEYISVLLRNGTDQLDRYEPGIDPDSVRLHDFGIKEWMQFAYRFAQEVRYFTPEDDSVATATWERFFKDDTELQEVLKELETQDGNLTPHLTLFICFLKLMEQSKGRLNKVTGRHLDFYYNDILQISKLPATEDKAFVLFQLAKNVSSYWVSEGTELDGGKDESGKKRIYKVCEELVATATKVAEVKNVYNEHNIVDEPGLTPGNRYAIKAAPVADSLDGIGGELTAESPTWYPFGYVVSEEEPTKSKTDLPDAKLGCAIASPVLRLSEGVRSVTVVFTFLQPLPTSLTATDLADNFEVYYTAEKGWKGAYLLETAASKTGITANQLKLTFQLDADQEPVDNYQSSIHGEHFVESIPVVRFLLQSNNSKGYEIYSTFATQVLTKVDINVHVTGMKKVILESDTAVLNDKKPFYPFTTQPVKGSSFSIANEEVFAKKWSNVKVNLKWKNTPNSFPSLYTAYETSLSENASVGGYKDLFIGYQFTQVKDVDGNSISYDKYEQIMPAFTFSPDNTNYNAIVKSDAYFKADVKVLHKETWGVASPESYVSLFEKTTDGKNFELTFDVSGTGLEAGKTAAIRLILQQSFLHELYPRLYAIALSSEDENALIPNEPYTPFAESLTLEYQASATIDVLETVEKKVTTRTSYLFHEHPFGQSEEHQYLKKTYSETSTNCHVFPTYCKGGELYIGLQNAKNLDLISLYFKVAEGTENPLAKSFQKGQKIEWAILGNNVWYSLDSSLMTVNETDNLLTSGRIRFTIPTHATADNTLLTPGLFWIRAKIYKRYDAVCQLHGIHAQAIQVQFENRSNSLEHLKSGLPKETISKLIQRVSPVKEISQPYASFGGVEEETDLLYYKRVSERLRHKNRAITLWDYEHLVLQQFPEVYKVKCLNHTDETDFTAPGNVTVIVVPDTVNKTVFDIYQPRVSKGLLNKIAAYLSELMSMHVSLNVINPNYEEVTIELGAKFYGGLDENNYRKQLETDMVKFLSPWAFEASKEIAFGVSFSRSTLIHYIEQLSYVDYIDSLKIYKNGVVQGNHCVPSNPKSILVSAKEHTILPARITSCDTDNTITSNETCQL